MMSDSDTKVMDDTASDSSWRVYAVAAVVLGLLALAVFGDVLLMKSDRVLSSRIGDGSQYFSRMRDFGFAEVAQGNIPLWNPHLFGGTPFVGNFQSAIFYPPNLTYLLLPLPAAMNLDISFHVFLTSFFMFCWARSRGLHGVASIVAGVILAYGSAYFLRVLAGHVTMLAALSWSPLLLLTVDKLIARPTARWTLIGIFATTMQVLAGHPQSLYMTALAVGAYGLLHLIKAEQRMKVIICFALIAVLPIFMGAVQLFTGLQVSQESMRTGGTSFDFASTFSFHPENLLTLLAPTVYGDTVHIMYWARWAYWDSTLFLGISGLALALYGALHGERAQRKFLVALALVFGLIALGRYTPVYQVVYSALPGLNSFRSPSKFMFPATLFISMLAGIGLDSLLRTPRRPTVLVGLLATVGVGLLVAGFVVRGISPGEDGLHPIGPVLEERSQLDDTFFDFRALQETFFEDVTTYAATSLFLAALTCVLLAPLFWFSAKHRFVTYGIALVLIAELFIYARYSRDTFRLSQNSRPELEEMYSQFSSEIRTLDVAGADNAMRNHAVTERRDIVWGYDPVVLGRYADYVVFAAGNRHFDDDVRRFAMWGNDPLTQGIHGPENFLTFTQTEPVQDFGLFTLLRTGLLVVNSAELDGRSGYLGIKNPAPRFFLTSDYQIHPNKEEMFQALADTTLDLRKTVLLESEPGITPSATLSASDRAAAVFTIVEHSTDHMIVETEIAESALLVMTDAYSPQWRVTALEGSVQDHYEMQPAYWALRCIPLEAGEHRFRLEYAPPAFAIGLWVSIISWAGFLVAVLILILKRIRSRGISTSKSG